MVVAFLVGCAMLLVAGASGVQAEDSKKEQASSPKATASQEARCQGTNPTKNPIAGSGGGPWTTNDLPGCPKGGLLKGTDKIDRLYGGDGDDVIRALGDSDLVIDGGGNDVIYLGPGDDVTQLGNLPNEWPGDDVIYGGSGQDDIGGHKGADVYHGGDGNDFIYDMRTRDRQPDKFYCGEGKDRYYADKIDYVDSSCEKGHLVDTGGPPLLLLAAAALCSALMMLRYVIRTA